FGFAENTDDLFVGKTLLHGDVLMWLMKTLLTSGCTNQRGAGQVTIRMGEKATFFSLPVSGFADVVEVVVLWFSSGLYSSLWG
ncbi:hypothetical protein ACO1Y9_28125, partial [Klebsiella quasipneumoniae]